MVSYPKYVKNACGQVLADNLPLLYKNELTSQRQALLRNELCVNWQKNTFPIILAVELLKKISTLHGHYKKTSQHEDLILIFEIPIVREYQLC